MPAPSTIVTIVDAEGDEFLVRVWGSVEDFGPVQIRQAALNELERLMGSEPRFNPMFPVTIPADRNPELVT